MKQITTIQTAPGAFKAVSGREAQLVRLIAQARPHEREDGAAGNFARLQLPKWREELAKVRGQL